MTQPRVIESDETCNDCGRALIYDHREEVYGCEKCGKVWRWEDIQDWGDPTSMPPAIASYSEYFGD